MLLKNTFWALTVASIWQANVQNICQASKNIWCVIIANITTTKMNVDGQIKLVGLAIRDVVLYLTKWKTDGPFVWASCF